MNTTTMRWTAGGKDFVITATADTFVAVRFAASTVATDDAKWALFRALDAESEGRLVDAIDAALDAAPIAYQEAA